MTFEVRFKEASERKVFEADSAADATEGVVAVDGVRESFLATHLLWTRHAYEDDWARNHRRLALGQECYFVTSILPRASGAAIWVWPVFRHGDKMLATQLFLSEETRGSHFDTATLAELIDFDDLRSSVGSEVSFFEVRSSDRAASGSCDDPNY